MTSHKSAENQARRLDFEQRRVWGEKSMSHAAFVPVLDHGKRAPLQSLAATQWVESTGANTGCTTLIQAPIEHSVKSARFRAHWGF